MWDIVIIGCGLSGMIAARKAADQEKKVLIIERRNHIGGNIFDVIDQEGFLIQKYGPHCFFTNDAKIRPYIERFVETEDCFVECRTVIDGMRIPMPFNFESIDLIYSKEHAGILKRELLEYFDGREIVSVTEVLNSSRQYIADYGKFMYEKEYKLYTAKQWGRPIDEISPKVFQRVPVYLSYRKEYQSHNYQFLPVGGYTRLSEKILDSENIEIILDCDAIKTGILNIQGNKAIINFRDKMFRGPVLFTGELDALFHYKYGILPYRSLEFIWKVFKQETYQETAIVAYPQVDKITRITEYKKLPVQQVDGLTEISIEIPMEYDFKAPVGNEPYYPVKNQENDRIYRKYLKMTEKIENLFLCGRLADYKYYNMDEVIQRSWDVTNEILKFGEDMER